MKTFQTATQVDFTDKNVLVRVDLEDALDGSPRLEATKEIINFLQEKSAKRIKVIGHNGDISLVEVLEVDINWDLRADTREEQNNPEFAAELAAGFDIYVNEAFAVSHRPHTSVVALPMFMKSQGKQVVMGLRFTHELEVLSQVLAKPGKKVLVVGGTKVADKNKYATALAGKFDHVCRGGLLDGSPLRADKLDITLEAIDEYIHTISQADVVVAAGVMGKYEDSASEMGTKQTLTAIAASKAYKIAGGGDIEQAIAKYGLRGKFDWISVGGGAMLEFLANGTLPGIEALS